MGQIAVQDWHDREWERERQSVSAAIRAHMSGDAPLSEEQLECLDKRILALTCLDG